VAYAIGLGNVWRFPYLCYKNGGGAFLVPYFITAVFAGLPMFFLECSLGQYVGSSGLGVWNIVPVLKGVGYAAMVNCAWMSTYYIVILAWILFYIIASLTNEVPWGSCGNWWNTETCVNAYARLNMSTFVSEDNRTLYDLNGTFYDAAKLTDPVKEYWERRVLMISDGLEFPGELRWELVGALAFVWLLVYFCIWRGIKSTGKVLYFVVLFPYCLLTVLLVRGATLPGAADGIAYYLTPDLSKLAEPEVWVDAVSQIFYSYGLTIGSLIAFGSFNPYHNNVYRQSFLVCCINSATSFISGFAIFSVIGFMAREQNKPFAEVAASGPGLVFLAYPSAILQLPLSPLWACLFFLMFMFLGLGSMIGTIQGLTLALLDEWPQLLRKRQATFLAVVCLASFLVGLSCVTEGGMYVFQLFNVFGSSDLVLLWIIFFESVAIAWVFGVDRFYDGLNDMLGFRPSRWFKFCWLFFTPLICASVFIFYLVKWTPFTYLDYTYPPWGQATALLLSLSSMLCVPAYAVYFVLRQKGSLAQKLRRAYRGVRPVTSVAQVRQLRLQNQTNSSPF